MLSILVLLLAITLDRLFGEPKRFHPLVGFGNLASRVEAKLNTPDSSKLTWGVFALILLCVAPALLIHAGSQLLQPYSWLMDIFIVYLAIGFSSLLLHSSRVEKALIDDGLGAAREQVAMMVSRDTVRMNEEQVASAAIESTLENGGDSTYAVVFWYMLGGASAVVLYRLANTLDAMWGYRTERYEKFGKAAARLDDVLNFIPARITAVLYAFSGDTGKAFDSWKNHAHLLASPNGGPVMSSGAASLNLKLGGPNFYHGEHTDKPYFGGEMPPTAADIKRANKLVTRSLIYWVLFATLFALTYEALS